MSIQPDTFHRVTADSLLAAIRSRGVDSNDLRFAVHEACHALQWRVTKPWTSDNIHAKKPKPHRIFGVAGGVRDEIQARAVEQLVCRRLGIDCGSVEQWAQVCWMETLKNERISLPTGDWLEKQILAEMASKSAERLADEVMAIQPKRVRRKP